ncbi:ESPR-type extended signal peptide-containing protein [Veillonella rogosae]|uniref:ESPR-type extended signal peptide-containing protein n=1 Tax=Veillonella rogosae TaxID=423477 RepID=UPI003990CE29
MNKIFKVVWSKSKECYVVVSEVAKNNGGKKKVLASVLAGLAMAGVGAFGNPALASYDDSGSKINIAPNAKTGNYVGNNSVVVGYENRTDSDNNNWGRIIYGANNIASGASTLALGNENEARGDATTAIGVGSKALDKQSVALGNVARATKQGSVAIGSYVNAETKNSGTTTAPVYNSKDVGQYSTAVGTQSWSKGDYSAAYGYQAEATDTNAVAIGRVSKATGTSATAVGVNNKAQAQDSSAVGSSNTIAAGATQASAFGRENTVNRGGTIAAGYKNTTDGDRNVAIGNENTTTGEETIGIGTKVIAGTGKTIAIGSVYNPGGGVEKQTIARGDDTINPATGQVNNIFALAIGNGAQADGKDNKASGMIAIGQDVLANNNNTIAMGIEAKATAAQAIAFGKAANASGSGALALGQVANASGHGSIAMGNGVQSTGVGSTGIGRTAKATSNGAVALGFSAEATADQAIAIGGDGKGAVQDAKTNQYAGLGEKTTASAKNAVAVGHQATANIEGGVALGSESKTTVAAGVQGYNPASDRTNKYSTQAGAVGTSTLAAVSIGEGVTKTRQLTGLAAGDADTDAVNVAQLKNVNLKYAGDTGNSDVLLKDHTLNINGDTDTFISTSADANGVKITAKVAKNITANADGKAVAPTTNGIATTDNVTQAINNSGWKVTSVNNGGTTNGSSSEKVSPGDTVKFSAGKNIVLDQAGKQFTYSLNKDVDLTKDGSLTIGDTVMNNGGMTITGGPSITKTGIDAGSKKITNVEKGTADTDAVNVKQLKDTEKHIKPGTYAVANDGSVTLKYVDGNGTEQTETAKITGIAKKSKVINGQNTTVEEGTDTADNSVTYKVNVKGDLANISSITNGAGSGKISFAGDQAVKVEGDNPISLDGKGGYVTGLQNKDWDITNPTVVSGRAATEDQLKKVSDGFNNTVKLAGNTGNTDTQKLSQAGGLSFGVVGANNGQYIKTTASGTDVVADLSDDAKAKLNHKVEVQGVGTNVHVTEDTTQAGKTIYKVAVDAATAATASTESVVKKADATGDTNIADVSVAGGKNVNDPGAQYEVSVSKNAVKDAAREAVTVNNGGNTNSPITVTPTDDAANHNTSYAVTFDGNKAAKVIPLTYKANGANDQTVTLEKGLNFTNGSNTTASVDADGVVKYDLNKDVDLTKNGSLTIGDTKVNNDGITIKAPTTPGTTTTDVKLTNTGLDNGGNKITNVAEGTNNTDAVNVKQLKENRTEVKAGDNVVVTTDVDATDNHTVYTVNAVTPAVYTTPDGEKLTKDKDGKFHKVGETAEYTGDIITSFENPKAAAGQTTKDGGMIVNNVGSAIKNQTGATYLDKLKAAADDNSNVKNAVVNVSDLKNTSDALIDKGLRFDANEGGEQTNKLGSKVTVQGTGALSTGKAYADEYNTANIRTNIEQGTDGNTTINVGLAKALKGINSISNGGSSITISDVPAGATTPAVTISGGNLSMGDGTANNKIVNLAPGTDGADAVNLNQLKGMRTVVTSTDKSVTVTPNENTTTGQVTYDLKVATTGTVSKSTWDLKSGVASATEGTHSGDTTQTIADTKSVTMQAGKNLTVKQTNDGNGNTSVTYSLDKDLTNLDKVVVNGKDGIAGKDGVTIVGPQGATGAPGIPGTNGIDGKVGISGKDGKDAVSIAGKDGVGTIGLTGPQGPAGTNGKSVDISTENGTKTLVKPEANNNNQSQRIVYVPKDANGNPLKDADNNDIKREVATMDDGLKFAGDDGQTNANKVIAKQLNQQVDIIGGATGTLTDNNIGVNNDGGKLKVQLAKDVDLTNAGSLTVGGTKVNNGGVTITAPVGGTTTDVKLTNTGLDNGGNKITNVAEGTNNTDAVNVKQLKENRTEVKAGDNVVVTTDVDATDNHTVYTVNAVTPAVYTTPDGEKLTKDKDGKFHKVGETAEYTGDIITSFENPKATAGQTTKDGGMIVNNVGSAIKNQTTTMPAGQTATYLDKLKAAADNNSNVKNAAVNVSDLHNTAEALKASELHIAPTTVKTGSTEAKGGVVSGTENIYKYDATSKKVTLTYNDGNGNAVTDTKAVIDFSDLNTGGTTASSWNVKSSANTTDGGAVGDNHDANAQNIADAKTVEFQSGKNLVVKQTNDTTNGNATVEFSLSDNIVAGKDGANGKDGSVGATGKDGSSVVLNGKDGSIGLTGPKGQDGKDGINGRDGADISITSAKGEQVLVNRDPANSGDTDKAERIVYVPKDANGDPIQGADGKNIVREVATMDDGLKFTGNNESTENKQKLGSLVKVKGEGTKEGADAAGTGKEIQTSDGTKFESAADNIAVEADGTDTLTVKLNKNLKGLDSVTTKEVKLGDANDNISIKKDGDRITYTTNNGGTATTNKVANLADELHITPGNYEVGATDKDANAKNDEVTLTYTDGNSAEKANTFAKIKGVAKSDLSNITDAGKKVITGLGTVVKAGDNVTVNEASDATTGQKTYTVNAVTPAVYTKADGTKVVKRPDGTYTTNIDGSAGNDVPASDVIVSIQDAAGNRTGGNSIVNNVGSAIDKAGTSTGDTFLTNLNNAATATPFAAVNVRDLKSTADALKASELHIAPTSVAAGSTEVVGGTASGNTNPGAATQAYKYNATTKQVELTFNDGNGKAVNGPKAVIDFSDLNVPAGGNNYGFKANATANGGTVANDATTPATATAVENGGTVNFAAGKNLTVKQDIDAANKTHTYTYSLDKDLTNLDKVVVNGKDGVAGKDGVTIVGPQGATGATGIPGTNGIDGKVGITGKDGKDAVSIAGKDGVGTIGLTGPQGPAGTNGKSVDISTENGTKTLVKPEANNNNQSQRIVYVPKDANGNPLKDADNNDIKREVATMDDGLTFTGNNESTENKQKLGSLVKVQGEGTKEGADATGAKEIQTSDGTKFESAKDNIAVEADGANTLTVKLNKDLKGLDSVTTKEVKLGDANDNISIKKDGDRITYTTPGSTDVHKVATLEDEMHIKDTTYTVDANKKVTLTYVDGNSKDVAGKKAIIDLSGLPVGDKDTDMRIKDGTYTATNGSVTLNTVDKGGNTVAGKDVVIKGINTNNYQAGDNVTFTNNGTDANGNPIVKINAEVSTEQVVAKAGNDNLATVAPATGSTQGGKNATYEVNVDKTNLENKAEISYKASTSADAGSQTAKKTTLANGFDFTSDNNSVAITTGPNGKVNFKVDTSNIQGKAFNLDVNKEGTGKVENAQNAATTPSVEKGTKFVAGNNLSIRHDGITGDNKYDHQVTYALNSDLKGITSITNNGGATMNFGPNEISMTGGNLNMGGSKITNVKNGTDKSDVATVGQLTKVTSNDNTVAINKTTDADGAPVYDLSVQGGGHDPRVDQLGEEIGRVGAQGAALAALKPIQYDPLEPTQIMAGYGNYRGNSAIAMGVAHYKNESTLMHAGVSWAGGSRHMMANAGVTWKVGNRDSEAAVADRYRKGPISSAYAMQQEMASVKAQNAGLKTEVSDLKAENEQMKAQIAAMMAKLGM